MRSIVLLLLLVVPAPALAYNFGFVRAPDWMDPLVGGLLLLQLPAWAVFLATRPAGATVVDVLKSPDAPVMTRASGLAAGVLFAALMLLVFVGMGLARA